MARIDCPQECGAPAEDPLLPCPYADATYGEEKFCACCPFCRMQCASAIEVFD